MLDWGCIFHEYDLISTSRKDPISKKGHIPRCQGLNTTCVFSWAVFKSNPSTGDKWRFIPPLVAPGCYEPKWAMALVSAWVYVHTILLI